MEQNKINLFPFSSHLEVLIYFLSIKAGIVPIIKIVMPRLPILFYPSFLFISLCLPNISVIVLFL